MDFKGPDPADLADVRCINAAFLELLCSAAGEPLRRDMAAGLRPLVAALTGWQTRRLAAAPFLLLSVHESDDAYWGRILDEDPVRDLFTGNDGPLDAEGRIAATALAFQWQLARRNLYAARLVSGAPLHWCERIASCTLLDLLQSAARQPRLLAPRLAAHPVFWSRLLGAGLSAADDVRRAGHLAALQIMLAEACATRGQRWQSAACYAAVPVLGTRGGQVVHEDD